MKDNNFDSIKEKFDNSGVNAPEAINEELLLEKLNHSAPLEMLPPKKSKKHVVAGISTAAAVALVTAGAFTFANVFGNQPQPLSGEMTLYHEAAGLRGFKNVGELKAMMHDVLTAKNNNNSLDNSYLYEALPSPLINDSMAGYNNSETGGSMTAGAASSAHNSTYVQHTGVDEADVIKTDGTFIYTISGYRDRVIIFSADGENAKQVGSVSLNHGDSDITSIHDFYIYGDKLILLANSFENDKALSTASYVYDVSDKSNISLIDSFSQSGFYVDSRMIDDTLYVVTNHHFYDEDDVPVTYGNRAATADSADSADAQQVPIDCVYSVECPADSSFLLVSRFNTNKGDKTTKAILGSADTIYCNRDNLYITALEYSRTTYDVLKGDDFDASKFSNDYTLSPFYYLPDETQIVKLSLENDIDFVASGRVKGEVSNQYALDEYNGNLRVATTTYENGSTSNSANHLVVLDKDLKQIGEVSGFAAGEHIEAVRYINETAYVITYEQTDPLFVIDLKNPARPTILGEVKIDGFSTMLVPVDDNTLLGIGYNTSSLSELYGEDETVSDMQYTNGLKLVLFDVTDKANPKVLDEKIFKDYDSEVQYNPRALVVNNERGDYTIPYTKYTDGGSYESVNPAGLLNFRVDNGKIVITDDYTSSKLSWEARCVYVGENQYLIGYAENTSPDFEYELSENGSKIIECVPYK